jgi:hypothetical protein
MSFRFLRLLTLGAACFLAGCGQSGSNPEVVREIRFTVVSADGAASDVGFEIQEVAAGGLSYTSLAGQRLSTVGVFSVFIEGADTPFRMKVVQRGPHPLIVRAGLTGGPFPTPSPDEINEAVTTGDGTTAIVGKPNLVVKPSNLEVRVDVCSPLQGETCGFPGELGVPGVDFSGTIGDVFITHLIGRLSGLDVPVTAPAVFFLHTPHGTVSSVLRSNAGQPLAGSIVIDGRPVTSHQSKDDVVLKSDI